MKPRTQSIAVLLALLLPLAACAASSTGNTPEPTVTVFPAVAGSPEETSTDAPAAEDATMEATTEATTEATEAGENAISTAAPEEASAPSFDSTTYRDENAGFALDYPIDWTLDPSSVVGVRGAQALLLSPGSSAETVVDGGTRLSITTYLWDPKHDLDAWVAQRRTAWDASGFTLLREEEWTLTDGRPAKLFVIQAPDSESITLLTTVGEDYLQVTGEGDLALAEAVLRTVRPLE